MSRLAQVGAVFLALALTPVLTGDAGSLAAQQHNCDFCHDVHGGVTSGSTALNRDADVETMCLTCHGDAGPGYTLGVGDTLTVSSVTAAVHDHPNYTETVVPDTLTPPWPYPDPISCWQCHGHESDAASNLSMIRASMTIPAGGTATVSFTANAVGSDYTGAQGVCSVCHTADGTIANSTAPGHQAEGCPTCHLHSDGFPPIEGGVGCTACHGSQQLASGHTHDPRRVVAGAGGDFGLTSVHLVGAYGTEDCQVCHEQVANHNTDELGVRLVDHTSASAPAIAIAHGADLSDPANVTETAKLETFCLGCHADGSADNTSVTFPDGSSATTPFTGLASVPQMAGPNAAWWNDATNSAHQTASTISGGCYGDGAFGCHGNGHGSSNPVLLAAADTTDGAVCVSCHDSVTGSASLTIDMTVYDASSHGSTGAIADCRACHAVHGSGKAKLFTPADGVLNGTTLYEQEEGFCFQCHDGGTASTDILSQFDDATINWAESEWGINSIATFNDRHDVTHAASSVSGAKIECADCHRPHADNSAQKFNPDPDPSSTPVSWTGQTTMDAFCIDCHDGGLPTGVLDHTPAMGDVATMFSGTDMHGPSVTTGANMNDSVGIETAIGSGVVSAEANPYLGSHVLECVQCHRPHPKAASAWPGTHKYDLFSFQDTVRAPDGRGMAYWEDISSMGNTTRTYFWDYGLTEDNSRSSALVEANAGGYFCNTCHNRRGMNGKDTCGSSGCHRHGGSTGM